MRNYTKGIDIEGTLKKRAFYSIEMRNDRVKSLFLIIFSSLFRGCTSVMSKMSNQ